MSATSHINYGGYSFSDRANQMVDDLLSAASEDTLAAISQKANYSTSDAALVNDMFGVALYVQSNLEANFYGSIPKVDRSGATVTAEQPMALSFRAAHTPPSLQTHSEGGSVPSGRTYSTEEVSADAKRSVAVVEQSDLQQIRAEIQDGVPFSELTRVDELFQELAIDRDALAAAVSASNSGYASRDEITELDRVIASSGEESNADDTSGTVFSDGDLDVYDIDRSADTWADAFVDHNSASGDRQLTEDLMDDFLSSFFDFGSATRENVFILTGSGTADVLSDLQQDSTDGVAVVNYDASDGGRDQINDAQTMHGLAGTTRFRHYKGIPIVKNQNAPSDSLSRIYMIPTDEISIPNGGTVPRLAIEEVMEPYFEESGRGRDQGFLATGEFKNKALYKMDHELVCRDFSSTGKLRDLQQ